jgi:hypothetical protein
MDELKTLLGRRNDPESFDLIVKLVLKAKNEIVSFLHDVILDENSPQYPAAAVSAIRLLGELRAKESVDLLASRIAFPAPSGGKRVILRLPDLAQDYPAVGALIEIGAPSVPAVLNVLSENSDALSLQNASWVLLQVLGDKCARLALDEALNKEQNPKRKDRIRKALQQFSAVPVNVKTKKPKAKTD